MASSSREPDRARRVFTIALGVCVLTSACVGVVGADPADDADVMDRLLHLMKRRLEIAQDVARSKWSRGAPIEDPGREQAVIDAAALQAARRGMDASRVQHFFQAQIASGKMVQAALFVQWKAVQLEKSADTLDLAGGIRPELDQLTIDLVAALEQALPALSRPGARQLLSRRAASVTSDMAGFEPAWRLAVDALAATP